MKIKITFHRSIVHSKKHMEGPDKKLRVDVDGTTLE